MGRWRPKKRKQWPKTELHPGVNYSRGYIPSVGGRASDEYSLRSGKVRSLRKWRQLALFALGTLVLFAAVAWFVWPHSSGFWDLVGAFAILGKYFVFVAGPLALIAVLIYYYSAVGTEWPVRTAYRLVMIGSVLGVAASAIILAVGYFEGRLGEYGSFWWLAAPALAVLAVVGYVGQRE